MVTKVKLPTKEERKQRKKDGKDTYHYSTEQLAKQRLQSKKAQVKKQVEKSQNKLKSAKRTLNKIKKLNDATGGKAALESSDLLSAPVSYKEYLEENALVAFEPNSGPQVDFLSSSEEQVLYGGAAGGGKSYALLGEALRYVHLLACRVLILRRTLDELDELIRDSKSFYQKGFPKAYYRKTDKMWVFPSGATIEFSYLDRDDDVYKYQGQSFTLVCFDELTHWPTPYPWNYLSSRVRTTDINIKCYMRATTNPGGVGAWWVKQMWKIDDIPHGKAFWGCDLESGKVLRYPMNHKKKPGQPLLRRRFIPARLSDNPYLWERGDYEARLLALPEIEKRRLLEGDWDIVEGAAFPEFDKTIHTIDPQKYFEEGAIPRSWFRMRGGDYGYSSPSAILWGALDSDGILYIYREFYGKGYIPDTLGQIIDELEKNDPNLMEAVLDESTFNQVGGITISEQINRHVSPQFLPSDRDRIVGKAQIHKRLRINEETGKPGILIFNNCTNIIRELQTIPMSKTISEDVDTKAQDHAYDALRYMCMQRKVESPDPYYERLLYNMPDIPPVPIDDVFGY